MALQLLNIFYFEPSPAYKGVSVLKRMGFFCFFFHLTFFYEDVNICIVIVYITVKNIDLLCLYVYKKN